MSSRMEGRGAHEPCFVEPVNHAQRLLERNRPPGLSPVWRMQIIHTDLVRTEGLQSVLEDSANILRGEEPGFQWEDPITDMSADDEVEMSWGNREATGVLCVHGRAV